MVSVYDEVQKISATLQSQRLSMDSRLRVYFVVPHIRIRNLIGRTDTFRCLDRVLSAGSGFGSLIPVIRGMGGQGKTQVALEFCNTRRKTIPKILWFDATSQTSLQRDFTQVFDTIKSSEAILDTPTAKISYVLRCFTDDDEKWLLVFDGYYDMSFNIQQYLPQGTSGTILITSRDANTSALVSHSQ